MSDPILSSFTSTLFLRFPTSTIAHSYHHHCAPYFEHHTKWPTSSILRREGRIIKARWRYRSKESKFSQGIKKHHHLGTSLKSSGNFYPYLFIQTMWSRWDNDERSLIVIRKMWCGHVSPLMIAHILGLYYKTYMCRVRNIIFIIK